MRSISLEKEIGKDQTVIVDSTMTIKSVAPWMEAITMIVAREAYTLIPRADGSLIRSPSISMPKPLVVGLNKYVPRHNKIMKNGDPVSRKTILNRDNWTCQYCGLFGDTIDHIIPKSRGGGNTWGNLCAACTDCNGYKSNMTPKEAGLKTPTIPSVYLPQQRNMLQDLVFEELKLMSV